MRARDNCRTYLERRELALVLLLAFGHLFGHLLPLLLAHGSSATLVLDIDLDFDALAAVPCNGEVDQLGLLSPRAAAFRAPRVGADHRLAVRGGDNT